MARYWVFAYECFYPEGGMSDFKGDWDDMAYAEAYCMAIPTDMEMRGHIYDTHKRKTVRSFSILYDYEAKRMVFEWD